ncbi:MAG TPA: M48 family metalloprotease [Methanocella sp.]|nr:M48 family metalloprotease [Methanocella sp.]
MMAPATGEGAAVIDFREKGEGREYLKKLIIPLVIVLLLAFIVAYALVEYGPEALAGRLIASAYLAFGMIVGAVAVFVLLRAFVRMRFYFHVISFSIKASRHNLPEIYGVAETAAGRLGMRAPGVYVVQDPAINAYALGLRRKIIVINTGLIDATDRDELTFIVGHELTHVKYGWAIPVRLAGITIPVPMLLSSRHREYTCDRGGLIACRDLDKSVLALATLALGKGLAGKIDVGRLYTSKEEVEADRISRLSEALATHPPIRDRVLHLREFYHSALYQELTR